MTNVMILNLPLASQKWSRRCETLFHCGWGLENDSQSGLKYSECKENHKCPRIVEEYFHLVSNLNTNIHKSHPNLRMTFATSLDSKYKSTSFSHQESAWKVHFPHQTCVLKPFLGAILIKKRRNGFSSKQLGDFKGFTGWGIQFVNKNQGAKHKGRFFVAVFGGISGAEMGYDVCEWYPSYYTTSYYIFITCYMFFLRLVNLPQFRSWIFVWKGSRFFGPCTEDSGHEPVKWGWGIHVFFVGCIDLTWRASKFMYIQGGRLCTSSVSRQVGHLPCQNTLGFFSKKNCEMHVVI